MLFQYVKLIELWYNGHLGSVSDLKNDGKSVHQKKFYFGYSGDYNVQYDEYDLSSNTTGVHNLLFCKMIWKELKKGRRPGLEVMGDDSSPRGHGFKSQRRILDGLVIFSRLFVVKIVLFVWKGRKLTKKRIVVGPFKKEWKNKKRRWPVPKNVFLQ